MLMNTSSLPELHPTAVGGTGNLHTSVLLPRVLFVLFCGLGAVLGNLLNLLILNEVKFISESQILLLKTLAITDFTTGVLLNMVLLQMGVTFSGSKDFCRSVKFCLFICSCFSAQTLMFIAIDKLILILRPLRHPYLITTFRIKLVLGILLLTMTVSLTFCLSADSFLDQMEYIPDTNTCLPTFTNPKRKPLVIVSSVLYVILPLVVITCSYIWLGLIARQQNRKIAVTSNKETSEELQRREWKGVKLALWITAVFLLTWSVTFIAVVLQTSDVFVAYDVKLVATCLTLTNSCCNTIIYFLTYREFRLKAIDIFTNGVKNIFAKSGH